MRVYRGPSLIESTSPRRLLSPKWLLSHVVIAAIAIGLIMLGLWQLDRHSEVAADNAVGRQRMETAPVPLLVALAEAADDSDSLQYRRVTVRGVYAASDEILIRSKVHPIGGAGFHLVTPLLIEEGPAILVNRGWVPLVLDTPPVVEAAPGEGSVTVTGWIELTQARPAFGPADPPDGRLERMNRIDIERIGRQLDYDLAPVYLVAEEMGDGLPEPIDRPRFDDAGPHLGYAIQWFGFALVGIVGYFFLARKRALQSPARPSTTS